jgi:hypothetical protein
MPTLPLKATLLPAPDASREEYVARALEMLSNTCPFDVTGHPVSRAIIRVSKTFFVRETWRTLPGAPTTLRVKVEANALSDPQRRQEFIDMQLRWLSVARS